MGFLKFLKKEKKERGADLDMPPEPPALGDMPDDLPPLPPLEEGMNLPETSFPPLPKMTTPKKKAVSKKKTAVMPKKIDIPPLPAEQELPPMPAMAPEVVPKMPEPVVHPPPLARMSPPVEEPPALEVHEELEQQEEGPLYVKATDFANIIEATNIIRENLKNADSVMKKINTIKNEKDKAFKEWREELEDIQRKLLFVDKIILEAK